MKIEIGESLVRTWVRHCKGCQLAELNWKPSPMWPGELTPDLERWYEDGATQFPKMVLKKTATISQFLSQAEVDVLGVRFMQGKIEKIIATDIAFHTNGLQYGPTAETAARIIKKLFRTALTLELHFPGIPAEIMFLSPKVNPATVPGVLDAERTMQSFFKGRRGHFQFRTVINESFKNIVLDAVTPLQTHVADTSELYLRATQLVGLFDNYPPPPSKLAIIPRKTVHLSTNQTLPIEFVPNDHEEFKRLLIERGAIKHEHYQDGQVKKKDWPAGNISESSNILGNLRSSKGYRQGEWQARGMTKLVVKIVGFET